jgi:hypothetical protein
MDDIIVGTSSSVANHTAAVHDVLDLLAEHDLFVKLSKCCFHIACINYLGVILEKGVTCMDPIKIAGIKDWPKPKKVKDVCSFLGFCNFYRSFIRGFAHLARPLNLLTRKDAIWQWGDKEQLAFDTLKTRVTSEPILAQCYESTTRIARLERLRISGVRVSAFLPRELGVCDLVGRSRLGPV